MAHVHCKWAWHLFIGNADSENANIGVLFKELHPCDGLKSVPTIVFVTNKDVLQCNYMR